MRTVKETAHTDKKQLTPKKVEQATSMFSKWLKNKGYMKDARASELRSLKAHMGRVIDNVNRQDKKTKHEGTNRKDKKTENEGAKTTPVTEKTPASSHGSDDGNGSVH